MNNNRLQLKIIGLFCILLTGMLAIQAFSISGSIAVTEDNVINNILEKEGEDYHVRYETDKTAPLPKLRNLQAFVGTAKMPQELADTIRGREDGLYETDGPGSIPGPSPYNILIRTLSDGKKLYLFYNPSQYIKETNMLVDTRDIHILIFSATAIFGITLFCILGFIVFKPLRSLSEKVKNAKPESMEHDFPEAVRDDEIGLLARNIQGSYDRIQKFVERERQFTRNVSHELRTPLSVITGAVDLIPVVAPDAPPHLEKVLARINRATGHMRQTITTFLWLAREENIRNTDHVCDVNAAVQSAMEDLPLQLKHEGVELSLHEDTQLLIPAPESVFLIVFTNILTNALTYTKAGTVDVRIGADHVSVSDTGLGIPEGIANDIHKPHIRGENSKGFGLGLSIATDICDRFNWQLSIHSRQPTGTKATISFTKQANQTIFSQS